MKVLLIWVGGYLLAGLMFIGAVVIFPKLQRKGSAPSEENDPGSELKVWVLVVLAWPVTLGVLLYAFLTYKPRIAPVYRAFLATPESLVGRHSIESVEKREIYYDPFDAVPPVPFGHLHQTWLRFRDQVENKDEVWSFIIDTRNDPGVEPMSKYGTVHGYALLRDGTVVRELLTRIE